MLLARHNRPGSALALLTERPWLSPFSRLAAVAAALSAIGCSGDRATEPQAERPGAHLSEAAAGSVRDDFTDVDGTPLLSHVPDGGSVPFSWLSTVWLDGEEEAVIQDNAVSATRSGNWVYVTSVETGDEVELAFEVFREITTAQDVGFFVRTAEGGFQDGISVFWGIGSTSNFVEVVEPNSGGHESVGLPAPLSQGLHTLRAEIVGSRLDVYADGARIISRTVTLPSARRTAIGLFRNAASDVRVTSFSAGPMQSPLACTPSVARGQQVSCAFTSSSNWSVTGWEFIPDSSSSLPTVQDTSTSNQWNGIAASGRVRVGVTDGTTQRTWESQFAVLDRTSFSVWSSMQTYRQGPEPLVPDVEPGLGVVLGRNCPEILLCIPTLRVQPDPQQKRGAGYTGTRIGSGPNTGYWYVAAASYNMKRIGNINPAILATSAHTHQLPKNTPKQCRQALGFVSNAAVFANFNQYNDKCKGISMTVFVDAVWGHEGFGYSGGQGHESLARTAAAEPKNDPYLAIEKLVFPDSASLESVVHSKVVPIAFDITQRSADPLPTGNYPAGPMWFWDAGSSAYLLYTINGF